MASGAADKIHVVTIDYRGFGYSTGNPTEQGLIVDGVALVKWAMEVAQIPPERIVILGQSLGTAVSTAVAEHFAVEHHIDFAGLVLVAAFADIPSLMLTYTIGGFIPVLSPLRPYPVLQKFFAKHIQETWHTGLRLERWIRSSNDFNLSLIHARNDFDIPWSHSDTLFHMAVYACSPGGLSVKEIDDAKEHQELGELGWVNTWDVNKQRGGLGKIRQEIVRHGGR